MNKCKLIYFASVLICCLPGSGALADGAQFHGFISQGMVSSQDNPFYVDETGTHFEYREIGLNASWQLNDNLRVAGQVLSRKAGVLDDGDPKIDFLLLDYNFLISDDQSAGIRLGRVKNPYGIYNTTRDVPHVRPGAFVPQSVYFETFRDALLSVDGANLYFNDHTHLGDLSFDLFGGVSPLENSEAEYQAFQKNIAGSYEEVDVVGLKLGFVPRNVPDLTMALSFIDISMDLQGAPTFTPVQQFVAGGILAADPTAYVNYVTSHSIDAFLTLLSLQYNWGDWVFTTEYLDIDIDLTNFEVLYQKRPDDGATSKAYYLQAEWFAGTKLSLYARHEALYYNIDDKYGSEFAQHTGGVAFSQYTQADTIGARWYFTPDLSLTGEFSRNKGTAFLNGADNIDYSQLKKNWDVFILQLSYHF